MPVRVSDVSVQLFKILQIAQHCDSYRQAWIVTFVKFTLQCSKQYDRVDVHRWICVEKKNQLDATEWFIALIICSACFGHFYAHHQELETICVLLPPMVCDALVAGCWRSGAGSRLCIQNEGCLAVAQHPSSLQWVPGLSRR